MHLLPGKFDGVPAQVSRAGGLVVRDDETFAVMQNKYSLPSCPYLQRHRSSGRTYPVSINEPGGGATFEAKYDVYTRKRAELPNTCIESAEHVLKCMHGGRHIAEPIKDGEVAKVIMSIGDDHEADIDVEDMNETAVSTFPRGRNYIIDARNEGFKAGEGFALVYTGPESERREGEWKMHAVAVLMHSLDLSDPFLVVAETFAPDRAANAKVKMTTEWKLAYYQNAQDFCGHHQEAMPPSKYTLWKLSARR